MMEKKQQHILEYEFDKTDGKPAWLLLLDKLSHIKSVMLLLFFCLSFVLNICCCRIFGFETGYKWNINLFHKVIGGLRMSAVFAV